MSGAVIPLQISRVIEPRVDIQAQRNYGVLYGGKEVSYQQFIATSFSDQNCTWDCNPPDVRTIVDRKVYVKMSYLLTFTGSDQGSNLLAIGTDDAPRAFPIAQTTQTLRASINNTTVSIDTNAVINALLWYHNDRRTRREDYSGTPSMLDQSQDYSTLTGFVRNPLGLYGDNTSEEARGGFVGMTVLTNTHTSATVLLTVREPLFLSPYLFGKRSDPGFVGINKMQVYLQFGDLTRAWSHATGGNTITTITASVTGGSQQAAGVSPTLEFCYITPKNIPPIPRSVYYPYFEVIEYVSPTVTVASGASSTTNTNSFFLSSIPKRIYLYVRREDKDRTYLTTDTFGYIQQISVKFGNRVGLFSSASPESLYLMSVNNGCNMSWNQWSKGVGSVICMEPGKDIGLDELNAPGVADGGQFFLQVTFTFSNPGLASVIYSPYVVVVNEGTILNEDARSIPQIGVITKADVLRSEESGVPQVSYQQAETIYGGDFFSSLKSFIGKTVPYVSTGLEIAKKACGALEKYGPLIGAGLEDPKQQNNRKRQRHEGKYPDERFQ